MTLNDYNGGYLVDTRYSLIPFKYAEKQGINGS